MFLADSGEVKVVMSAEERISREPELMARVVGGRRDGLEASGVLLRFPIMLLAMVTNKGLGVAK